MADKIYEGGIPQSGFQTNAGVSSEGETSFQPGGPAVKPTTVKDGGPTQAKSGDEEASEAFLLDDSYKGNMDVTRVDDENMTIVNPDDISRADHS